MKQLEVEDLQEHISEIRRILEEDGAVEITAHGEVIGHLVPPSEKKQPVKRDVYAYWRKIDQLAAQVGTHLSGKVDAVEIVREGRREL